MNPMYSLRRLTAATSVALALIFSGAGLTHAADKTVSVGITLPLTGADAEDSARVRDGFLMAIQEANEKHMVPGYTLNAVVYDTASVTSGQYDPALAAVTAKKLISDTNVVANLGPYMSGEGKAMTPILSAANLATITATSTNPDLTDPKFAAQFRPEGKAIYFRTCTTDAYQGPNLANYLKQKLGVKRVYVLDDGGVGGVGQANAFEAQAKKIGIEVLGHDTLNPKEVDYTVVLTKIKGLNADALYYGGVGGAGTKVVKQSYTILPNIIKASGDGIYGPDVLKGAGIEAYEGWYITTPAPHMLDKPEAKGWIDSFVKRFNSQPSDYSVVAYDGGLVVVDAIKSVVASGKELNRSNVRDAIQQTKLVLLQGDVAFDENGDILNKEISVFQVKHDPKYPEDDVAHQFTYIGVAPTSPNG
jgi:branched-chain amino acid transport system substrate-binding protein